MCQTMGCRTKDVEYTPVDGLQRRALLDQLQDSGKHYCARFWQELGMALFSVLGMALFSVLGMALSMNER